MAVYSFALKFWTTEEIDAERNSSVNKETRQGFRRCSINSSVPGFTTVCKYVSDFA